MNAKYVLVVFSAALLLKITPTVAEQSTAVPPEFLKSLTIIFEPPKGMENDFLNTFVKEQSKYMSTYSNYKESNTETINLIPTELGEPLIHLMIYHDKESYDRAVKIFSMPSNLRNYINEHANTYGGKTIPKIYLQNSKIYFNNITKN